MVSFISTLLPLLTLLVTLAPATSLKADERVQRVQQQAPTAAASGANDGDGDIDLFAWARRHGAKIAESVEIRDTPYGGRGLFAKRRIPANAELVRIPHRLQLGVRQLAEGTDDEMQRTARSLPWELVLRSEISFVPLGVALLAETRRAASGDGIFGPFLRSLPRRCPNDMGAAVAGGEGEEDGDDDDDLRDLRRWAPHVADRIRRRRAGIRRLHKAVAPPSVSLEDLRRASAQVCSRSLVRRRTRPLSSVEAERVGAFAASDRARMLPVVDLVNHGSLERANVRVGHLPPGGSKGDAGDDNDFSTSLTSTRDVEAGEELLFDYGGGGGERVGNDRLLLDYGFVLPGHTERASIGLEEFRAAVSGLGGDRAGMEDVPEEQLEELESFASVLIEQASKAQAGAPLAFAPSGEPGAWTLAVAVATTCRGLDDVTRVLRPVRHDDVTRVLRPVRQLADRQCDAGSILGRVLESCTTLQKEYARFALKRAAASALARRPSIADDADDDGRNRDSRGDGANVRFADVAREYSRMCREILRKAADMSR